jgi:hypothetical protein
MYTFDIIALYTNIKIEHAIFIIMEELKDKLINEHLTSTGLFEILKLLFYNNIFTYNKTYYFVQTISIAMGSIAGPSIANIVVYKLEQKWLNINKPIVFLYKIFIDYIIMILTELIDMQSFLNTFDYLK